MENITEISSWEYDEQNDLYVIHITIDMDRLMRSADFSMISHIREAKLFEIFKEVAIVSNKAGLDGLKLKGFRLEPPYPLVNKLEIYLFFTDQECTVDDPAVELALSGEPKPDSPWGRAVAELINTISIFTVI